MNTNELLSNINREVGEVHQKVTLLIEQRTDIEKRVRQLEAPNSRFLFTALLTWIGIR